MTRGGIELKNSPDILNRLLFGGGVIMKRIILFVKNKKVLLSLLLVVVVLMATLSMDMRTALGAPVAVSTLNGKYITVDGISVKIMNTTGYGLGILGNGLGQYTWPLGLSKIQGWAKNKSYIKESRYATLSEYSAYKNTVYRNYQSWLMDPGEAYSYTGDYGYEFLVSGVNFEDTVGKLPAYTTSIYTRPAIVLESTVTILSGAGTEASPYVLESSYSATGVDTSPSQALTVIDGKPFTLNVAGGDTIADGTAVSGVTVTNTNSTDGYIQLSGTLTGTGLQVISIGGIKFVFDKTAVTSGTQSVTKSKIVIFDEKSNPTQSKVVNIPGLQSVSNVRITSSNGGAVTSSISGDNVTIGVSGGAYSIRVWDSQRYSKAVTAQLVSNYSDAEGYTGTLGQYVYSGSYTAGESKTAAQTYVTTAGYDMNGGGYYITGSVPGSINYNAGDGYSGALFPTGVVNYTESDVTGWWVYTAYVGFSGTVTKPATDTRVYRYQGTAYKADYDYFYTYIVEFDYLDGTLGTEAGESNTAPALTVIDGRPFNIVVAGGDAIATGTASGGVTVTNTNMTDGFVKLSGTLTGLGERVVTIDGIKFIFKIISAPSGSTITATFS